MANLTYDKGWSLSFQLLNLLHVYPIVLVLTNLFLCLQIAAEVSAPLARTDEIVLVGDDRTTSEVSRLISQLPPAVQALTGVDLSKVGTLNLLVIVHPLMLSSSLLIFSSHMTYFLIQIYPWFKILNWFIIRNWLIDNCFFFILQYLNLFDIICFDTGNFDFNILLHFDRKSELVPITQFHGLMNLNYTKHTKENICFWVKARTCVFSCWRVL